MIISYKENKVGGGVSREIYVDNEYKGSIFIDDKPFELGYQATTLDRPYKGRYFKTIKNAERFIVRNGQKFQSLTKALNTAFGCEYVK
jgi:hypothetical protein